MIQVFQVNLLQINFRKSANIVLEFHERLMESVIKRGRVNIENTCGSLGIVASESKCQLPTQSVSSKGGGANLILIHKSQNVISHFVHIERGVSVAGTEVSRVEKINISVVEESVIRIAEESSPVLH